MINQSTIEIKRIKKDINIQNTWIPKHHKVTIKPQGIIESMTRLQKAIVTELLISTDTLIDTWKGIDTGEIITITKIGKEGNDHPRHQGSTDTVHPFEMITMTGIDMKEEITGTFIMMIVIVGTIDTIHIIEKKNDNMKETEDPQNSIRTVQSIVTKMIVQNNHLIDTETHLTTQEAINEHPRVQRCPVRTPNLSYPLLLPLLTL